MSPPFMGMDVIGKTHDGFVITSRVLHGYFNRDIIQFSIGINRSFKDDILVFVDVFYITSNPTLIVVIFRLLLPFTLVRDRDP